MLTKGFSLIELMVVIAIVAILAAVAVPSYISYQGKVKLNNAYVVMQNFAQQLATQYQTTGAWPSTMTFGGTTFGPSYTTTSAGTGTAQIISGVPIDQLSYTINNGYTNNAIAYIQAVLDTSIGSWVTSGSTAFKLAVSVNASTGVTTYPCGQWPTGDSRDVPTTYLPSNCTCNSMNSYSGGTGTTAPCG